MLRLASRRTALRLLSAASAMLAIPRMATARTPAQTAGPFYPPPDQRFADDDWDLVKIEGAVRQAGGEILHLSGRVLAPDGSPLAGARVEIWQCDMTGTYLHAGDREAGGGDPAFQGFGHVTTGGDGAWRFRTIRPVSYPGRAPLIHIRVAPPGRRPLTTQLYVEDEPLNGRDFRYRSLGQEGQNALTLKLSRRADQSLEGTIDLVF